MSGGSGEIINPNTKYPQQAWDLIKFLSTNTQAGVYLSNKLDNLPVTHAELHSPNVLPVKNFLNFFPIFEDPKSQFIPTITQVGSEYTNLIAISGGGHSVAGTVSGPRGGARVVMVDEHSVDLSPAPNMLVVRNEDRPGMIGAVGTMLGEAGISISNMAVGQSPSGGAAMMVLSTATAVPTEVVERVAASPGIIDVHRVVLNPAG